MKNIDRFLLEGEDLEEKALDASLTRHISATAKDLKYTGLLTALEKSLLAWEPRDVRLEPVYLQDHDIEGTSSDFLQDVVKGMKLKVVKRYPEQGMIDVGVLFQNNLAEFERYDDVVAEHNARWIGAGEPEDVIDPLTGDITELDDKFVMPAGTNRTNPYGKSTGPLSKAMPKETRRQLMIITLRITSKKSLFTLGFVAKDKNSRILYYNEITSKDLNYLTRRCIQELFGNPRENGSIGEFLEGIPMLINGKKIAYCKTQPDWVGGEVKNIATEQVITTAKISSCNFLAGLLRYAFLIVGIITMVAVTWNAFVINFTPDSPRHIGAGTVLLILGVILLVMYGAVRASGWLARKAFNMDLASKFD